MEKQIIDDDKAACDRAFGYLTEKVKKCKSVQDAHIRIGSHIRTVTNQRINNIAVFHQDDGFTPIEKTAIYKKIFNVLIHKDGIDWSKLEGAGAANETAQPLEVKNHQRREANRRDASIQRHVDPLASIKKDVLGKRASSIHFDEIDDNKSEPEIIEMPTDPLTREVIKAVIPYLKIQSSGGMDEKRVEEIADQVARAAIAETQSDSDKDLSEKLKTALSNGSFPTERVQSLIDQAIEKIEQNSVQRVVLCKLDGSAKEVDGRQHYKFPLLLAALGQRLNVALVGPAGSSKTTTAHNAARALELPFEAISVGPMTSKSDLLGFVDANGKYHGTATVRRAVEGGIMLWDEFDAANASVATYGNMLLANDEFGTSEGMKKKHKDFCLIAGLNTYGMGANRVYVGRNQLDGATLDRFVVIDWDYDEGLEASIVGLKKKSPKLDMMMGGEIAPDQWMDYVLSVRKTCENLAIRHVVSPRATIHGCKLILAGVGRSHVENMVLWKGLDAATVNKIKSAI